MIPEPYFPNVIKKIYDFIEVNDKYKTIVETIPRGYDNTDPLKDGFYKVTKISKKWKIVSHYFGKPDNECTFVRTNKIAPTLECPWEVEYFDNDIIYYDRKTFEQKLKSFFNKHFENSGITLDLYDAIILYYSKNGKYPYDFMKSMKKSMIESKSLPLFRFNQTDIELEEIGFSLANYFPYKLYNSDEDESSDKSLPDQKIHSAFDNHHLIYDQREIYVYKYDEKELTELFENFIIEAKEKIVKKVKTIGNKKYKLTDIY